LERLTELAMGNGVEEDVGDACIILSALWRMTNLIIPPLHTRTMRVLRTSDQYTGVRTLCEAVLVGGYSTYLTRIQSEYPHIQWSPLNNGEPFVIHCSTFDTSNVANISTDHIYALLFVNRIPLSWVETMYAPCLHLICNRPLAVHSLEALNTAHIAYINALGHFPEGDPRFNHWMAPTSDDQIHLANLMMGDKKPPEHGLCSFPLALM
jgi:hypothetical protein